MRASARMAVYSSGDERCILRRRRTVLFMLSYANTIIFVRLYTLWHSVCAPHAMMMMVCWFLLKGLPPTQRRTSHRQPQTRNEQERTILFPKHCRCVVAKRKRKHSTHTQTAAQRRHGGAITRKAGQMLPQCILSLLTGTQQILQHGWFLCVGVVVASAICVWN